ncbi:hypothetical protein [Thermoactinospora rubra]|uniref:hypothetical protein n=1 Tax=Thermoactinospora rubra TaxID=1088767 RepID=UPI000A0F931B|nr:hypothetical protein [Thermoactinospora rubra]
MPRVIVAIEYVAGARKQAACRTGSCGWRGTRHIVLADAEEEARAHRQWHRAQQPVPDVEASA